MTLFSFSHPLPASSTSAGPRIRAAAASITGAARRALAVVWTALKAVGAARGRRELLQLAREHEAMRPEFAATLRDAARRGWM